MKLSLAPRERRFFALFDDHIAVTVEAVRQLRAAMGDPVALAETQHRIKELEHQGDDITHELVRTLNRTFVTPFDREDIYALISALDDVLDLVDEIPSTVSLYGITTVPPIACTMIDHLVSAAEQLQQAIGKMEHNQGVEEHEIEIHRLENLGDEAVRRGIAELFSGSYEALDVIKLKDLYSVIENALDRCEDVANIIESIAIKNA